MVAVGLDVVGGWAPVVAVTLGVQARPRLLARERGIAEEVVYPARVGLDQGREHPPLRLVEALPVDQRAQPWCVQVGVPPGMQRKKPCAA